MVRILRHELVDSTSERAFEALAAGEARDGDVHVARGQSAGRGRLGRRWESAPDEGLYLSWVHAPEGAAPPPPALTMAAGLAVLDAVHGLGLEGAALEWPNDVTVARGSERAAKLAGILVESRALDPARPRFVIGIGVNVAQRAFPTELLRERPVTSLHLEGLATTPDALLEPLLAALGARLEQARREPGPLGEAFLTGLGLAGRRVRVRTARGEHAGELVAVHPADGLVLATERGSTTLELPHVHAVEPAGL